MDTDKDVVFTPAVREIQARRGSRRAYENMERRGGFKHAITPELAAFIAARDSFFLATSNSAGQPYVQHRGGPPGFLKPIGSRTLAFADFAGNRQYITLGHLKANYRCPIACWNTGFGVSQAVQTFFIHSKTANLPGRNKGVG